MVDEHQSFQVRILAGSSPKLIKLGRRSCEPPTQVARVRGDSVKIRGCVCIRGSSAAQIHVRASVRAPPVRSVFLKGAQSASDHRIHLFGWDLPVPVKGRRGPFQPSLQPVDAQVFPLAREAFIPFLAPRSYRQMPGLCGTNRALCCLTSEVERDPVHSTRYGRRRHYVTAHAYHSGQKEPRCAIMQICSVFVLLHFHQAHEVQESHTAQSHIITDLCCSKMSTIHSGHY